MTKKIAILIPCYNEGKSVSSVVGSFRKQLPDADIYVYDNNSSDNTYQEAVNAGAIVRRETRQGKGNVIRSMFKQIEADVYVMVDGDGTYPAERVHELIQPVIDDRADMTIGSRLHRLSASRFKVLNWLGNKAFLFVLNTIFKMNVTDLLSGYRAFSRHLVKSLPVLSRGFEVETELTVKCFERGHRIVEIPVNLVPRQQGSESKISIIRDGVLILSTIFSLFRDYKPLTVFGSFGLVLMFCGAVPGYLVVWGHDAAVRIPLLLLSGGFVLSGLISIFVGLILHSISRHFKEQDYLLENLLLKDARDRR